LRRSVVSAIICRLAKMCVTPTTFAASVHGMRSFSIRTIPCPHRRQKLVAGSKSCFILNLLSQGAVGVQGGFRADRPFEPWREQGRQACDNEHRLQF
jgi:hypothetical protein